MTKRLKTTLLALPLFLVFLNSPAPAADAERSIPDRDQVDAAFQWRTQDIFESDEAWEKALEEIKGRVSGISDFKGRLGSSPETLLECFRFQEEIGVLMRRLFGYASLKKDEDTRVTKYQDFFDRVYGVAVEFRTAGSYVTPEILAIPEEKMQSFLDDECLALYRHDLEDTLRQKAHVLSEKEEALLASGGNVFRAPSDVFNLLLNADMTFPKITGEDGKEVETSNALYYVLRGSPDRAVRKANEEAFHGTFRKYRNTLSALMRANVQRDIFFARARNYASSLDSALDGPNIPKEVYLNLIDSVNENIAPLHRYAALRKRILGVDELHGYDLYNSLFPEADMTVTFDEAKELLAEGLKPLGADYLKVMTGGVDGGWLDVYANKGKRSGAYSSGVYGVHPFILLNYYDRLEDAFTLAHELGHAMHSYYAQKSQPLTYSGYTLFCAEIASTTNETLLVNHLLKVTKDRNKRLFLLDHYLDSIRNTFFRQTLFAEFELLIHQYAEAGRTLTADLLDKTYGELVQKYYGPAFVLDEYKAVEWSRIPHFYRNFYVYTYATGISAAAAFSNKILEEGDEARDRYIDVFLSGGSSDYSTELLKKAGVDMTSKEPVIATTQLFDSLLDELEKLLDEE